MPRAAALETLARVDRGSRARETLSELATARGLAPRDGDLARELVQGVLRHRGALGAVLAVRMSRPLEKTNAAVRRILELGAYQILHLDRVPRRAAVHSAVELAKTSGSARASGFVNAVLRSLAGSAGTPAPGEGDDPRRCYLRGDGTHVLLGEEVFPDPAEDLPAHLAARWSHPAWLVSRLLEQRGPEATAAVLAAGIQRPSLSLRPAAAHREELLAALAAKEIETEVEGPCLLARSAGRVDRLPGFTEGWFTVQDPTAAEVVELLAPQPGESALDLCAAPGGKTIALAEGVGDTGIVLAADRANSRLDLLRESLERCGLDNVGVLEADATEGRTLPKSVKGRETPGFDVVLLDAPCSNSGVLGRRVEARWRLTPEKTAALAVQAGRLMDVAATRVGPGGRLLYSTCSVDREENEQVVAAFLERVGATFDLVTERLTLPVGGRRDGGYAALLIRTAGG